MIVNKSLADIVEKWLKYPQGLLSTIVIGNTIVNILISIVLVLFFLNIFPFFKQEVNEFLAWVIGVFAILLFGDITPKLYCRENPEKVSKVFLKPLGIIYELIRPLLLPLLLFIEKIMKIKIYSMSKTYTTTMSEIREVIRHLSDRKSILDDTREMLLNASRLDEISAEDVMIRKFYKIDLDKLNGLPIDKFVESGKSRLPIFINDKPKGYVSAKDLLLKSMDGDNSLDGIIKPIHIVRTDKKINEMLVEFQRSRIPIALVKNKDDGKIVGLVTLEDVLEEIFGEIFDEYDYQRYGSRDIY